MGTEETTRKRLQDEQTYAIIGAALEVHRLLGSGFLEAVYQSALELEFSARRIDYQREVLLPIHYKGKSLGKGYRADFLCCGEILVELKAIEQFSKADEAQMVHYLVAGQLSRGLLFNFGRSALLYRRFVGPRFRPPSSSNP